jgi:hypothetical protein
MNCKADRHTFVFKKIAHPSPASQDELRDIFHNLGLLLW